jgi:mannose-1-phosphate guanylyltransferase/phosphomannomutase
MLELGGHPIMEHTVELCRKAGIRHLFVNLHYHPEIIRGYFGDGSKWGVSIQYRNEKSLLGTGGAVKGFERKLRGQPFLVVYGDNFIPYDLKKIIKRHRKSKAEMSLVVFWKRDVRESGVVTMERNGRVAAFHEKPTGRPPSHWVNAGVYVLEPQLLRRMRKGVSDFGSDVIPDFLERDVRIMAIQVNRPVIAVDTPDLYKKWIGK